MENYRSRLFSEQSELSIKIEKLKNFIFSDKFESLSSIDKEELREQYIHMERYYYILSSRISRQLNNA